MVIVVCIVVSVTPLSENDKFTTKLVYLLDIIIVYIRLSLYSNDYTCIINVKNGWSAAVV